jgi:uncharacterized membrane protein
MDERERARRAVTTVEVSVEVDAPSERVWEITSDPRNLPRWDKHIAAVKVPKRGLSQGATYEVRMRFMTVRARVGAEVVRWEPPTHAVVKLHGLLEATITTTIAALPDDRSLLRQQVDYRFAGGTLGQIAARSLRALGGAEFGLKRGVMAQKREAEDW